MELWFIYALLSALFAGLSSFLTKVSAELNHDSSTVTIYANFVGGFIALFIFLINLENYSPLYLIIFLGVITSVLHTVGALTRIESLRSIHTTLFFPIYKTLGPIFILFLSIIFFSERLTTMEAIGFGLGIVVPLLLINKAENKRQMNLKRGMIFLVIATISSGIAAALAKVITLNNLNITLVMFITLTLGGFFAMWTRRFGKHKKYSTKYVKSVGSLNGILVFFSLYFFAKSTIGGNLGVVFTINSFYILIPIILSIFIYKEHFNTKKALAIVLTIASLWFFN